MGWNSLKNSKGKLFQNLPEDPYLYFVHSYYVETGDQTTSFCEYGEQFSAGFESSNFYGVQFHPEKSGAIGAKIIQNFLE